MGNLPTVGLPTNSFSAGIWNPLALHLSVLDALSPVPVIQSCASPSKDNSQSLLVSPCLDQSFCCQSPFQIPDLLQFLKITSSSTLQTDQLAFPGCLKAVGFFRGGNLACDDASSSTEVFFHFLNPHFFACSLWKHPVPRASIFPLTVLYHACDVFNDAVSKLCSQVSGHLLDRSVCCATSTEQMSLE